MTNKERPHIQNTSIRKGTHEDCPAMQNLCVKTISFICRKNYLPNQIKAWISSIEEQQWPFLFSNQKVWVAEKENKILGFATLKNRNYIDYLFVHHRFQQEGIGSRLLEVCEKEVVAQKRKELFAEVSITALPFFRIKGFKTIKKQTVIRKGIKLINYRMKKNL